MQVKKLKVSRVLWSITLGAVLIGSLQGMGKVYSFMKKAGTKSYQGPGSHGGGDTGGFRS